MLHVHDLVDYVSEESDIAGKAAAKYIIGQSANALCVPIELSVDGKVRYTVPQRIQNAEEVVVYFRVADVYRDVKIVVRDGDEVIVSKKKQKVAPGEMETVKLSADMLSAVKSGKLSFSIE